MRLTTIFLLLLLASCGAETDSPRCYSKEEILNICIAQRIGETGETSEVARLWCSPNFQYDRCYLIEEAR